MGSLLFLTQRVMYDGPLDNHKEGSKAQKSTGNAVQKETVAPTATVRG